MVDQPAIAIRVANAPSHPGWLTRYLVTVAVEAFQQVSRSRGKKSRNKEDSSKIRFSAASIFRA